ncbi:ABC transporter substrate-binding protein [Streptomyces sp. NPDC051940]|uniref:sugar ABC transporter substrate-binding protein n=1 Tax=Streptomyces sp. NPDC051940 TaxID=3155675 RepID=UPI0034167A55
MPGISRRAILSSSVAGAAALGLAACGQKVDGDGDSGADKPSGPVVYWSAWAQGTPQQKILDAACQEFTKATGIEVDINWLGPNLATSLPTAVPGGTGPDLFDCTADKLGGYHVSGFTTDLSDLLTTKVTGEAKTLGEVLPEGALKVCRTADGQLGFVPHTFLSTTLWFDGAAHADLAKNPPKDWNAFLKALDAAAHDKLVPIAQDGTVDNLNIRWFYWPLLRLKGAGALAALGTDKTAAAWRDPAVRQAAEAVETLARGEYFQRGYAGSKYPNAQNQWAGGEVLFNLNGSWLPQETAAQQKSGFKPVALPFPQLPGGGTRPVVEVGALGWAVSAKAKNAQAARLLIPFLMQKKYEEQIAGQAQNIPARSDVQAPEVLAGVREQIMTATEPFPSFDNAPAAAGTWYVDVMGPLATKLATGRISAGKFVAEGAAQTAAYWKNHG